MALLLGSGPGPAQPPPEPESGFIPLFNGVDLTGWEIYSGQGLVVEEGALVGNPKGPGLLRTTEMFEDFDLRLEFWVDRGETHEANGGIFFRFGDGDPQARGYECQISLQDEKNPSGSLYNLIPQNLELMRSIAPERQWNRVRILAVGPRVQIWFNDEPVQDATVGEFRRGYIGLQHHHNGCIIKYRNLRLKGLTSADAEPGWLPLFNGESLDGWTAHGQAAWRVEDGRIVAEGGLGNLYHTARPWTDFELRGMAWIGPQGNSGVLFRARWPDDEPDGWAIGYEFQIDNWDAANTTGLKNVTGGLYGRAYAPLLARDEAWFAFRIRAVGNHLQTWVNGRRVTDIHDDAFDHGFVGLQSFGPGTRLMFSDLLIRPAEPPAQSPP